MDIWKIYEKALKNHNWDYANEPDFRKFKSGVASYERLVELSWQVKAIDEERARALVDLYRPIRGNNG